VNPKHVACDIQAAFGRSLDAAQRAQMAAAIV
jgi:hypothetical protein